jgi:hypothetical protein
MVRMYDAIRVIYHNKNNMLRSTEAKLYNARTIQVRCLMLLCKANTRAQLAAPNVQRSCLLVARFQTTFGIGSPISPVWRYADVGDALGVCK